MPALSLRSRNDTTQLTTPSFSVKRKQPAHFIMIIACTIVAHPSPPNFLSPFHPSRSSLRHLRCLSFAVLTFFTFTFLFAFARASAFADDNDEHMLATMSLYGYSRRATLSLTWYTLSFSTRSVLETTLDRPTPRAFAFLCARHGIALNGSIDPPLTPPAPSLSATSTLPSLFTSGRPRDTPLRSMTQHTVPSIACCSKSMQHARTDTDSPVAQISLLDAPDLNPVHYLPFLHVVIGEDWSDIFKV
ncbi:uncharacterized protein FOMMEDRAFT_159668 [Fomitiporia mediterranea MF3/22]|uniref:uncharacterized protein n=1 Tax=Fomitiporia mediterranea (strain MF3/22) TaxID=694068 RepID=UPI00044073A3|nr:uncharacterized protein FOMMEDRAFT_159668 [Fomitiporia mediterranea MF3/22]EJD00061.1 hypothetical protein FOMMEDRAFT_159668 [Fomitiporia mediterranea MF3/22]